MTHDPLCPRTTGGDDLHKVEIAPGWTYRVPEWECRCELIARAREDEREQAAQRIMALYSTGNSDLIWRAFKIAAAAARGQS